MTFKWIAPAHCSVAVFRLLCGGSPSRDVCRKHFALTYESNPDIAARAGGLRGTDEGVPQASGELASGSASERRLWLAEAGAGLFDRC